MKSIWRRMENLLGPTRSCDSLANKKLKQLRRLDRKRSIFGAEKHRYQTRRLSEPDLREWDVLCGAPLPPAFRHHLTEVGSGAGPYYGLFDLIQVQTWYEDFRNANAEETGKTVSPDRPFPLSLEDAKRIRERQASGSTEPWIESDWPLNGCIPICHQGCEYWTVLVVSGDCAGYVWDASEGGLWLPSRRPTGQVSKSRTSRARLPELPSPPTFEEWYLGWLDQAIADCSIQ